MSDDQQKDSGDGQQRDGQQRDSRLKTFLRRASAIIAAEKGLTPVAHAKLDELAQSLHLPDELFQVGLEQLQASNAPIANLTDYEEAFLKFLDREFSQKQSGDVLSVSIEEKAISYANSRYGIVAHRAEQLIDYQANLSGIGRLSRSDAREFGRQMILEIVGDQLTLNDGQQNKIDRISRRWGCGTDEVHELVNGRLRDNRIAISRAKRRPLIFAAVAVVSLLAMAGGGKWVHDNFDRVFGERIAVTDPLPSEDTAAANPVEARSELELAFADLADSIVSDDPSVRGQAMAAATERVLQRPDQIEGQKMAISSWFLNEPSPLVTKRFLQTIETNLNAAPETSRNDALERPYRAASWAVELCDSKTVSPEKVVLLRRLLAKKVGAELRSDDPPTLAAIFAAIATGQWNQLIENSYHTPARCSILVEPLAELTESKLPKSERQQFESRAVRTIILADREQWRNMKQPILSAIRSSDEVQRMEWIDIWVDQFDGSLDFREFAADALLTGFPEKLRPSSKDAEARLRADRSAWRNRKYEVALLRQKQIQKRVDQLEPFFESASPRVNPDVVYQAALTGNLCLEAMAIMDSGRASQESAWRDVDAQLERFDLRLREFVFLDNQAIDDTVISSAGLDTTLRDRTLKTLADLSEKNQPRRLAAIERLPKLTKKFPSIPQKQARSLARYILASHGPHEYLKLQFVLPTLLAWPKVVLSVSDQLVESKAAEEQLRTSFSILTGGLPDPNARFSREMMALRLLELAHELLLAKEEVDPNSAASDWLRLEKYLQQAYWQRASLLTKDPSLPNASLLRNLRHSAIALADRPRTTQRAIELIEQSAENDLEQVVLLNRLLLPSKAAKIEGPLGARLLQSELGLLRKWNEDRERELKGVVDGF